ncbi:EamA family transporter [Candidatus Dojkabacteria bacterium]|nr:EamA family transporter [Candidatus Dojkabacteria bacterium]
MNPIYLVLIGAVFLGFAEAISGHLLKKFENVTSVGLILIGSVVTFILSGLWLIIFNPPMIALDIRLVGLIVTVGILSYFANKYFYNSFKLQAASTSTIIVMSTIIVTTIFGRIVFREEVTLIQWGGVLLVALAVLLINMGGITLEKLKGVFNPTKATQYVLFAAFLYGLSNGISKLLVQDIDPHYYQFLDILLVTPIFFLLDWKEAVEQVKVLKTSRAFWYIAPVIFFYFTYNILKYIAFSKGLELPLADAVDNVVVFVIIILEFLIFRIRATNLLFKLMVTIIAVIGVTLIRVGGSF